MIQPTELRIGNSVFYEGEVWFIDSIHQDVCGVMKGERGAIILYNRMSPIPLTPEILEKCGFGENPQHEHPAFDEYSLLSNNRFAIGDFNGEYWVVDGIDQWLLEHKIYYLHQLQNLYFALTGEELKVQL